MKHKTSILLIYTGGTIGMIQDASTGHLRPFNFDALTEQIPELKKFGVQLDSFSFETPIDSSNMTPTIWVQIAKQIKLNYKKYGGCAIHHGSDTMAYTASALSFMLENLSKPVILTGSQLPIGIIRTDGKENLITAIEIASTKIKNKPIVSEVCIYFEYRLYRGNRTHKFNAEHFDAFKSHNYPELAEAGVNIKYNFNYISKPSKASLKIHTSLNTNIAILKIFPGIQPALIDAILSIKNLEGLVLETFGAGNCTTEKWFGDKLAKAINKGLLVLNVTQCNAGSVDQGKYATSAQLKKVGVIGGKDITIEAAVTKLMFILGLKVSQKDRKKALQSNLRGEITL